MLAVLGPAAGAAPPHGDPDPARRVARRIVQRLAGMGKWGGYHTAFEHLPRGFAGNDRELADVVGERLLDAGPAARSRASASATSSSTRAGPPTSTRCRDGGVVPPGSAAAVIGSGP